MKTLADFQPLKPAEQKLLEYCQSGEVAVIEKERPTEKTYANEIRADFLRWLILTKEVDIDPVGLQVYGALISGVLNLENTQFINVLWFLMCTFEEPLLLRRAITKTIYFDGTFFQKGVHADGLICQGNFHLCGCQAESETRFLGAKIEGDFNCSKSNFQSCVAEQKALNCDGISVLGYVFLRYVVSQNEINFVSAKVGRDFDCMGAILENNPYPLVCDKINVDGTVYLNNDFNSDGELRFFGAKIKGDFSCINATFKASNKENALNCEGISIGGKIALSENCKILDGIIDLTSASVGALDDKNFWQQESLKQIKLDGLTYKYIYGCTSASFRLKNILAKMPEFAPQPYKQLAKVLREMGHDRDADKVMIALHDKRLELQKKDLQEAIKHIFSYSLRLCTLIISFILWTFYKWTSAYGYLPMRAFGIMFFVWLSCGLIYDYSAKRAVFAPTNPLIYKPKYQDQLQETNCTLDINGTSWFASADDYNTSKNNWYYATHAEYTTFQPYWYSLDIILPIVDLKMENDWSVAIPSPDGSFLKTYNYFVRSLVWIESLIGWGLSLMLAAILSGLAKNEKE